LDEIKNGTHPRNSDTDGDGIFDGDEIKNGTNPLKKDITKDLKSSNQDSDETDDTPIHSKLWMIPILLIILIVLYRIWLIIKRNKEK